MEDQDVAKTVWLTRCGRGLTADMHTADMLTHNVDNTFYYENTPTL